MTEADDTRMGELDLAIIICTFHREELLARALDSLKQQTCKPDIALKVIVVDNSDAGTAAPVVAASAVGAPFQIEWMAAHPANISIARNAGVAVANARYIAFVDDDQELQAGWLQAVATAMATLPHDVFFGAVEPVFESAGLPTGMVRMLFSRSLAAPAGTELFAMGPNKTSGISLATCNSVFRRSAMINGKKAAGDGPFDVAFGHGGGEDYDLICRMQQVGSRFAWLPDACAREWVPASRCNPRYLRSRFFAGGQAFAAAIANTSARPVLARWLLRSKALLQGALLAMQLPLQICRGRSAVTDYSYVWAGVLGKLSLRDIYPIYRK